MWEVNHTIALPKASLMNVNRRVMMKLKKFKRISILLITALWIVASAVSVSALDDDEFNGYPADSLTIKVGYFGGPYYEKAVFSLDELWAMDVVYADYTFIDNMPSVVIDHVAGVRMSDIMDAAGIDLNSIQTFYFWTNDKTSSYYTSYPKTELIDTPRYVYYSVPENFDTEAGCGNADATSVSERVDTLIALADDWNRCIAGASFGSDYMNLNTNTRFRLIFGQTDSYTHTASRSAKWIHEIVVELGGAPTVNLDASVLEGEVGSVLRTEASVGAADLVIAENVPVTWTSSDESIATVDENGNITVHSEGTAVITATFAGVSASVTVNGSAGETESMAETGTSGGEINGSGSGGSSESSGNSVASAAPTAAGSSQMAEIAPSNGMEESNSTLSAAHSVADSGGEEGGVQNWRMYEMSRTAVELPVIEEDNPLQKFTGIASMILFCAAILLRILKFIIDTGDIRYVFTVKSK